MVCEICGSGGALLKAIVEDAELNVCENCSKFGKVVGNVQSKQRPISPKTAETEKIPILIDNYTDMVRKKRESLGLTQEEFAKKISEKESLVHKLESGSFEPSLQLAKKIEKLLGIKILEEYEEKHERQKNVKYESFTLGDFVKIKNK